MSEKKETKRYATRYGLHYSVVMKPSVTQVINGTPVTTPGKTIVFENGMYETDDKAEQKFLDACPQNGRDFREVTGEMDAALEAKSLEEREKEIEEREADLEKREMALKGQGHEEGSAAPKAETGAGRSKPAGQTGGSKEKEKEEATF